MFNKFPSVNLGDFKLRDLMLSDVKGYFEMMSDPEAVKYLSDEDIPKTLEEAEHEVKFWGGLFYRKLSVFWSLADSKTDEFMGTIGYNSWNPHNRRGEISYDLMSKHWRKGIMLKALNSALAFGFKEMNLYRIEARTMIDNIPSISLLEKVGFKKEGVMRGYRVIRSEPTDIIMFSLIKPEYNALLA